LGDALHHELAIALVGGRHQNRELVASDSCRMIGFADEFVQDLAGSAQQPIPGGMAPLIVDGLETVEIRNDDRGREGALALEAVEFIDIERAIVELGEYVVLAEVLEIGFSLLARRDVREGDLDERPVVFVTGQHRKLEMEVQFAAVERIIENFALLKQLSLP